MWDVVLHKSEINLNLKVEWSGDGMVQLAPKTYCAFDKVTPTVRGMVTDILNKTEDFNLETAEAEENKLKLSTKGLSKRCVLLLILSSHC